MSSSRANSASLFKRLKLLDEQELDRLIERQIRQYDPSIHSMAQMKKDMDNVLSREDIPAEEKIALFKASQQRFNKIKPQEAAVGVPLVAAPAMDNIFVPGAPPAPPPPTHHLYDHIVGPPPPVGIQAAPIGADGQAMARMIQVKE